MKHMDLRTARMRLGWSQEQLAAAADVKQSVISRLENGHINNPSFDTVKRLASALKLDPRALTFGEAVAS